jgi:hypothetical protein
MHVSTDFGGVVRAGILNNFPHTLRFAPTGAKHSYPGRLFYQFFLGFLPPKPTIQWFLFFWGYSGFLGLCFGNPTGFAGQGMEPRFYPSGIGSWQVVRCRAFSNLPPPNWL